MTEHDRQVASQIAGLPSIDHNHKFLLDLIRRLQNEIDQKNGLTTINYPRR